jgi:formylglycine-generating enzyme required for sulfatase activity
LLQAVRDDLETVPPRDRGFLRYFTITHLYNAGVSEDELQTYRHALAKLINSLSWDPEIAVPRPVDPARTVLRIDLRHYRWNPGTWNLLLAQYPYGIRYGRGATAQAIRDATGTDVPVVRADWFVFAASRPPLYHDLLELPRTDRELETALNVDAAANIREERVARAGFVRSGVSQNNRMIERHKTGYGAYWKSYDFADNRERRNLMEHPLGPPPRGNAFQHDGGEIIYNLPNGLQGYLLDAQGRRIDRGPIQIVKDPRQADGTVVNGISCMSCHVRGVIAKEDEIRGHVQNNLAAFGGEAESILAVYLPRDKFADLLRKDAERFAVAVKQTGAPLSNTDPIVALAARFEWDLDLKLTAAEVGLTGSDFLARLETAPAKLSRVFGPLKVGGGTVKRQVVEAAFADLVQEVAGEPLWKPPAATPVAAPEVVNSIGMRLRLIPAGRFMMGSPPGEKGRRADETQHEVMISRPFYMGVYHVTQEEYEKVMGHNPSGFSPGGLDRLAVRGLTTKHFPVERVSWEDAVQFCERLSNRPEESQAGRVYRLPTEAEWEFACRGGAREVTAFAGGPSLSSHQANFDGTQPYDSVAGPFLGRPEKVGSYLPNGFGLHDMHGNVWQWCADWYDKDTYSNSPGKDSAGPATGNFRVLRGGSWQESARDCRSAVRHHSLPGFRNHGYGFRIILVVEGTK